MTWDDLFTLMLRAILKRNHSDLNIFRAPVTKAARMSFDSLENEIDHRSSVPLYTRLEPQSRPITTHRRIPLHKNVSCHHVSWSHCLTEETQCHCIKSTDSRLSSWCIARRCSTMRRYLQGTEGSLSVRVTFCIGDSLLCHKVWAHERHRGGCRTLKMHWRVTW